MSFKLRSRTVLSAEYTTKGVNLTECHAPPCAFGCSGGSAVQADHERVDPSLALLGLLDRDGELLRLANGGLQFLRAALIKQAVRFGSRHIFLHFRPKFTTAAEKCNQLIHYWQGLKPGIIKMIPCFMILFLFYPSKRILFSNKTGNQFDDYNGTPYNFPSLLPMRIRLAWHMECPTCFVSPCLTNRFRL